MYVAETRRGIRTSLQWIAVITGPSHLFRRELMEQVDGIEVIVAPIGERWYDHRAHA